MNVLLPYQQKWIDDKSLIKVCEKSRRIGLSYAEALASVLEAAKNKEAGGQNTYYLSYNKEMTQQFIKDCADWAKNLHQAISEIDEILDDEDKDITVYRIRFASGFTIWGLPSEARSLRSKQGRVIIDEAAFVENLPELLKAANALLMWGGCVRIISTHNGDDNPFNDLIKDIRAGRKNYSLQSVSLDEALEEGLYKRICHTLGKSWSIEEETIWRNTLIADYGDGAEEELFCIPNRSSGAFLTSSLIENCMENLPLIYWQEPAKDFVDWQLELSTSYTNTWIKDNLLSILSAMPHGYKNFIGVDFGRSGDLSVFWILTELPNLSLESSFCIELRNCPHRTQKDILFSIIKALPRFTGIALDARGNGSALAELARQEFGLPHVDEVMITESWYRETMPKLKARLEDKMITLPKNNDILNDLRSLRVVKGVARIPDKRGQDSTGKRHGDSAVALAMAIYAREKMGINEEWEYSGVPIKTYIDFTNY